MATPQNTALETDQNARFACVLAAQLSRSAAWIGGLDRMKITSETRFHGWLFGALVTVIVVGASLIIDLISSLPSWAGLIVLPIGFLMSVFGYQLIAHGALAAARELPWILKKTLREEYVHGFWIGIITGSSGNTSRAIERYRQSPSGVDIDGESYWPDGALAARWETTSGYMDPRGPYVRVIFRTTIFDEDGNVEMITGGFGELRLENDHIAGHVIDNPKLIKNDNGEKRWTPKTFHYDMSPVNDKTARTFREVMATQEWNDLCNKHGHEITRQGGLT